MVPLQGWVGGPAATGRNWGFDRPLPDALLIGAEKTAVHRP